MRHTPVVLICVNHNRAMTRFTDGRQEFKQFQKAVSTIGMKFSDRHNALYQESSAATLLVTMCREGMCAVLCRITPRKYAPSTTG